jgi:hypothetical protein
MQVMVTIKGADLIEKELARLPIKVSKRIVRDSVRAGANVTLRVAKELSRGIVGGQTGKMMAQALRVSAFRRQRKGQYGMTLSFDTQKYPLKHVTAEGKEYFIPHAIEYGHVAVDGSPVAAIPFLRPAVEASRRQAENMILQKLITGIEEAW